MHVKYSNVNGDVNNAVSDIDIDLKVDKGLGVTTGFRQHGKPFAESYSFINYPANRI
jgi:hypothetical protein